MVVYLKISWQEMLVYKCVKGSSVTHPDVPTYRAIKEGYCVPTCGMNTASIKCKFEGRFRDSAIQSQDVSKPPYTAIYGTDFKHYKTTSTYSTRTSTTRYSSSHGGGSSSHYRTEEPGASAESGGGSCTGDYLCGCQVVPSSTVPRLEQVMALHLSNE